MLEDLKSVRVFAKCLGICKVLKDLQSVWGFAKCLGICKVLGDLQSVISQIIIRNKITINNPLLSFHFTLSWSLIKNDIRKINELTDEDNEIDEEDEELKDGFKDNDEHFEGSCIESNQQANESFQYIIILSPLL